MATITQARLVGPMQPATGSTTYYTVPASTQVILKEIVVCNGTGAAAVFTMTAGSAQAIGNTLFQQYSVAANSTAVFALSTVLIAADTILMNQGTASALTVTISGVTIV